MAESDDSICPFCQKKFSNVLQHIRAKHVPLSADPPAPPVVSLPAPPPVAQIPSTLNVQQSTKDMCPICKKNVKDVQAHLDSQHHGKQPCPICQKLVKSVEAHCAALHRSSSSSQPPQPPEKVENKKENPNSTMSSLPQQAPLPLAAPQVQCPNCGLMTKSLVVHHSQKQEKRDCPICGSSTKNLCGHLMNKHQDKSMISELLGPSSTQVPPKPVGNSEICPGCGIYFVNLGAHMAQKREKSNCPHCAKTVTNICAHIRSVHSNDKQAPSTPLHVPAPTSAQTSVPLNPFAMKKGDGVGTSLLTAKKTHPSQKIPPFPYGEPIRPPAPIIPESLVEYACSLCSDAVFSTSAQFSQHCQKVHYDKALRYGCHICGLVYNTPDQVVSHTQQVHHQ